MTQQKTIIIQELNLEIERELHTDMNTPSKIKIPEGWRLLTLAEFIEIWNKHRNKLDFGGKLVDEIVKQPIEDNEKKYPYWNIWFRGLGNRSELFYSGGVLHSGSDRVRGVRFCRELKK